MRFLLAVFLSCIVVSPALALVPRPCPSWYPIEFSFCLLLSLLCIITPLFAKYYALKIKTETCEIKKLFLKFNIVFYPLSLTAAIFIVSGFEGYRYTLNVEGNGYGPILKVVGSLLGIIVFAALEKHGYQNLPNNGIAARHPFRTTMFSWIATAVYYYVAFTMSRSENVSSGGSCAPGNMREITCMTIAAYTVFFVVLTIWIKGLFRKWKKQKKADQRGGSKGSE